MPEQAPPPAHRGTRAIQRMVEFAPSTGGLALWMHHRDLPDAGAGPLVATDGRTIFYGAAFARLPIAQQAGLVAHEVLHVALRHPQRFLDLKHLAGDVDLALFNLCADAIVNSALDHLTWLTLPDTSVFLDKLIATSLDIDQPVEKSLLQWDVEQLYRAIDDRRPPDRGGKGRDPRRAEGGDAQGARGTAASSSHREDSEPDNAGPRADGPKSARARAMADARHADLLPTADAQSAPEQEAEQAREWSERLLRAHTGDGEHSMLRALIADLPKVRTPWEQVLRTRLARSLTPKPEVSWSRPSRSYLANQGRAGPTRRMPWEPGFSGRKTAPRLVVVVDVSGSIDSALLERFSREIDAITRRLAAALVLVIGDLQVRRVAHFAPGRSDLRSIEFHGGGGTDFTPLLEEADRHDPDMTVVLTDLQGPARFRPRSAVLWAVPEAWRSAEPPFGRKLVLGLVP